MADEAVLRIVLQDAGTTTAGGGGAPAPGGAPPQPSAGTAGGAPPPGFGHTTGRFTPANVRGLVPGSEAYLQYAKELAIKRKEREDLLQEVDRIYHEMYPTPTVQFDPRVEAQRQLDAAERRAQVEVEQRKLQGRPSREQEEFGNRVQDALQLAHEEDKRFAQEEARRERLRRQEAEDFDKRIHNALVLTHEEDKRATAEAKSRESKRQQEEADFDKRVQDALRLAHEEDKRAAAEAKTREASFNERMQDALRLAHEEDKRLKQEEAARRAENPYEIARKRREGQRKSAQAGAAYDALYGNQSGETRLDKILEVANQFRGTVGGLAGVIVGATLDVIAKIRRAQIDVAQERQKSDLLRGTTKAMSAQQSSSPSSTAGISTDATTAAAEGAEAGIGAEAGAALAVAAVVPVVGIIILTILAAAAAFKLLVQAIEETEKKYTEYSPEVAQAQAIAEIRGTMNDLRRSREIGPQLAEYIRSRTDMQQQYEEIKTRLLGKLLPLVSSIYEAITFVGVGVERVVSVVPGVQDAGIALQLLPASLRALNQWLQGQQGDTPRDPTEMLFRISGRPGQMGFPEGV